MAIIMHTATPHLSQQVSRAGQQADNVSIIQGAVSHDLPPLTPCSPGLHQPGQPQVDRQRGIHPCLDLRDQRPRSRHMQSEAYAFRSRAYRLK